MVQINITSCKSSNVRRYDGMSILWKTLSPPLRPPDHSVRHEESQEMEECPVKYNKEKLSNTGRSIKKETSERLPPPRGA